MKTIDSKFNEIRAFCEKNANSEIVKKYSRFFTEGYDAYGVHKDLFIAQRDKWLDDWKDELSFQDYIDLGNKLVSTGKYEEASFAITFMYSMTDQFTNDAFEKLGFWLDNGIVNWGHTDVLSGMAISHFFSSNMLEIEALSAWTKSECIWKRRAVPVTLVEMVKTDVALLRIFAIINPLMMDEAKKVQQGLGWLLREAWKRDSEVTEKFLLKWKDSCGRTIIQYATEKMTKEHRLKFRRNKKK